MPKKEEIVESMISTSLNSKNNIDEDWRALKKEYDIATKKQATEVQKQLIKERDDFARMWCDAGLDLKETLIERGLRKKN
tara:strand:- start:546 stop:785 length:240 start_codon:yes stop_codon:yes gene_type:complete